LLTAGYAAYLMAPAVQNDLSDLLRAIFPGPPIRESEWSAMGAR
jgi:hypothetical protein